MDDLFNISDIKLTRLDRFKQHGGDVCCYIKTTHNCKTIVMSSIPDPSCFGLLLLLLTGRYLKCRTHGRDQSQGHQTEIRMKSVSWFHRLGPPTAKERSPSITVLAGGGTTRRQCINDRRHRLDELRCSNWKYRQGQAHAVPCRPADNV